MVNKTALAELSTRGRYNALKFGLSISKLDSLPERIADALEKSKKKT